MTNESFVHDVSARNQAELSAASSRALLQGLMDALRAEILLVDQEGRIVAVNCAWTRYARYRGLRDDGIGADYAVVFASFVDGRGQISQLQAGLSDVLSGRAATFRLEFARRGEAMRCFQLSTSRFAVAGSLRAVISHEDVTEVRESASALQQITDCLLRAQESERRRIARELHDSTAQNLAAATMIIDRLSAKRTGGAELRTAAMLSELRGIIMEALAEIRNFSYLLHPPRLDGVGLPVALASYARGFAERSGIAVAVGVASDIPRVPCEVERGLFRVAQEALANIRRHSGSRTARLVLRLEGAQIRLQIEDDGRGFGAGMLAERGDSLRTVGVGIVGMRARLRQLGGEIEIRSSCRGTVVIATAPVRHAGAKPVQQHVDEVADV